MCKNPCDKLKYVVCQKEHTCDGNWFLPCGTSCFMYIPYWEKRNKEANYIIDECLTCTSKE